MSGSTAPIITTSLTSLFRLPKQQRRNGYPYMATLSGSRCGGEDPQRHSVFRHYCLYVSGVSIVADRFMSSIEVITSMERTVIVKRPGLQPTKVKVRIWNDTVSNLTLMALGSSA
uniref:Uncharacterized protein n=1 Tax=Ditylenchus dipsaci TaxID=166011 RepID=A0A915DH12_9BILA